MKHFLEAEQQNEINEHYVYSALAKIDKKNSKVLNQIAKDELKHYNYFKTKTKKEIKPQMRKVNWYVFMARFFGITFTLRLMEKGEENAQANYKKAKIPVNIIKDENKHEQELLGLLKENKLKYVGSVVLGLNDALVELTGALAGLSMAFQNTRVIAFTGLITGIAAAMSMAASEYLSTKADGRKDYKVSSIYTGIAYICTVTLLVIPYFIFTNYLVALIVMMAIAILIIFIFNYYISVAQNLNFKKRFWEMALISLGVSAVSFVIGLIVKNMFGGVL